MNSRSGGNEANLANFSAELTTTLNQLDSKDSLLSFPFDHIYACNSDTPDPRALQIEKEVEVGSNCVIPEDKGPVTGTDVDQITKRLAVAEAENKRLKDFLIFHLDLIQQQNEIISKREKIYLNIKQENDSLKSMISERDIARNSRLSAANSAIPHSLVTTSTVTSTIVSNSTDGPSQVMLNSLTEFLLPTNATNSYIFDENLTGTKSFIADPFEMPRPPDTDVTPFLPTDLPSPTLDNKLGSNKLNMIENKRSIIKKEVKTETRAEALYTVTSNSGNPDIQRIQRNRRAPPTGIGSLNRMNKNKAKVSETNKPENERTFNINKKPKMISTFGKVRGGAVKKTTQFGSLSDRLQLIDTTPTGEDPYQLGEDDMREQSPIPKLMLQKTNHGRMKIPKETSMTSGGRIYDAPATETSTKSKTKTNRYMANTYASTNKEPVKRVMMEESDLSLVQTDSEIDWRSFDPPKPRTETSLCDFSYGETSNNLAANLLPSLDFQELLSTDNLNSDSDLDSLSEVYFSPMEKPPPVKPPPVKPPAVKPPAVKPAPVKPAPVKPSPVKPGKRGRRNSIAHVNNTTITHIDVPEATATKAPSNAEVKRGGESKRGRKRALSTTVLTKTPKAKPPPKPKAARGRAACRGKKSPVPGMMTRKRYQTQVGDPDLSWYLGLDPELKPEDIDPPADCKPPTVEVPSWRVKHYTSCYSMEGTENTDDSVYEKRHQKLEAEEKRQQRWHMRRMREQRHVERLRQRQRGGCEERPAVYTMWPRPLQDIRYIEITDELPVNGFGEPIPDLPPKDFTLPWVMKSKALKRMKRSKTLH